MSPKKPGQRPEPRPAALASGSIPAIPITRAGEACARVDRVAEYLDGTLAAASQEELLTHLTTCEVCQRALHGEIQLRDREDDLRAAAASSASSAGVKAARSADVVEPDRPEVHAPVVSLDAARASRNARLRKLAGPAAAALTVAAIAAAAMFVVRTRPEPQSSSQIALAPERLLEARLTWGLAAAHRPQAEIMRSGAKPTATAGEEISIELRATLERDRDCAGLAATYLLMGETANAQRQYAKRECPQTPDVKADHAALAVELRDYDLALELTDAVLAEQPDHPVALWNRALALREKKFGLAAAAAFERVAATDPDPAWRAEAKEKAAAARAPLVEANRQWDLLAKLGAEMIPDGAIIPDDLARAIPGFARMRFYDAARTATTPRRLDELRRLARAIQSADDHSLEEALDDAATRLSPARAALVPHYVELFRAQSIEGDPQWPQWSARARAAGASDLLLGILYLTQPNDPETARLAAASKVPWFLGLSLVDRYDDHSARNDVTNAAAPLVQLEALCDRTGLRYLCLRAAIARADLSLDSTLAAATVTAAQRALDLANADGEFFIRAMAIYYLAEGERLRNAFSVARAHYEEYREWAQLRGDCEQQRNATAAIGEMEFERHRFAEAERVLAATPSCSSSLPAPLLNAQLDLLLARGKLDAAAWKRELERSAKERTNESEQLAYEYLSLREQLREDRASDPSVRDRMLELIARAAGSKATVASRAKTAAEVALVVDAGQRGQWKQALELAAAAHRVPVPSRCALLKAQDNFQLVSAVVSAAGQLVGKYEEDVVISGDWRLPADQLAALSGCDAISVLAFPPWPIGAEPLLSPSLPWSFSLREAPSPTETSLPGGSLIVANSQPPEELRLPTLPPLRRPDPSATLLSGQAATIANLAARAPAASLIELHVHTAKIPESDAPVLALSSAPTGWALTAEIISGWKLAKKPVVLLADCSSAVPAQYDHVVWGLPAAFLQAGARAVVASLVDIPDGEGGEFFAQIREGLRHEPDVAKVVARLRAEKIATSSTSWVRYVVVFQ